MRKKGDNMDEDGKEGDKQTDNNVYGNQLPAYGQHNAAGGAVQKEGEGAGSMIQQNKEVGVKCASAGVKVSNKPIIVLSQNGITANGTGQWKANLMPTPNDSGLLNKVKVQNGGTVSPVRSSKRNATTTDQDSLEKASKLKARKNLDTSSDKGKETQPISFISRDDSTLLAATKSLGGVLGVNEQAVSNSLQSLRDLELYSLNVNERLVEGNKILLDDTSTICSADDNIDLEALNLICSEISEGLGDGGCDPVCLQTPVSQKKGSHPRHKKKNHKKSR
jgi:hypothetical protein